MDLPGTNLLGANQWQTLQLQDAAKGQQHPVPKAVEVDLRAIHQQPATAASVVPVGSPAVKLDLPPGRPDTQQDRPSHEHGGETGASPDDEPDDGQQDPSRRTFTDREELIAFVLGADRSDWMRWCEAAEFTPSTRHLLGDLLAPGAGAAAGYAKESIRAGSNISLLQRCLEGTLASFGRQDTERGTKLLAVLMTGFVKIDFLSDFFRLALLETAEVGGARLIEELRQVLEHLRQLP